MKASIITHVLSSHTEEDLFEFIKNFNGKVISARYDSKSTFYKLEFNDGEARSNFSKAYESYTFQ